jgi:hypothetical protein
VDANRGRCRLGLGGKSLPYGGNLAGDSWGYAFVSVLTGQEKIKIAIDNLLKPLPDDVLVEQSEISLKINKFLILNN